MASLPVTNHEAPRLKRPDGRTSDRAPWETRSMPESTAGRQETDGQPWQNRGVLEEFYIGKGMSQSEVADELGCTRSTVARWLKKHSIQTRDQGDPVAIHQESPWTSKSTLKSLYIGQNLTIRGVAERFGCDDSTIHYWLKKHGISTRPRGGEQSPAHPKLKDRRWLKSQYRDNYRGTEDIGRELGCDESTVRRWLQKHGVETRPQQPVSPKLDDEDLLREWYEDGVGTPEIAARIGCSETAVVYHMDRHGIERRSQDEITGEDAPNWKGGHEPYYGPSWRPQRQKALARDGHQCVVCGGTELVHVHHIRPFRTFGLENHEQANALDNLVCLCPEHHGRWEGIPLRPTTD